MSCDIKYSSCGNYAIKQVNHGLAIVVSNSKLTSIIAIYHHKDFSKFLGKIDKSIPLSLAIDKLSNIDILDNKLYYAAVIHTYLRPF